MNATAEITETDPAELVAQWAKLAKGAARRFVLAGESRADFEQEALLALVRAATAYNPDLGPFGPWALTAINRHLGRYRARTRRASPKQWQRSEIPLEDFATEAAEESGSWLIDHGLRRLRATDRELVSRYFGIAGMERATSAQLAAELGVSANRITRRIRAIVADLRDRLASEG